MGHYYHRISAVLDERFHGLLARWLAKLPAAGWEGTPRELADVLWAEARSGEYVGRHVMPKVEAATHTLQEAGFVLEQTRTRKARRVTIRRVKTNSRK